MARTLSLTELRGGPIKKVLGNLCTNLKKFILVGTAGWERKLALQLGLVCGKEDACFLKLKGLCCGITKYTVVE